MDKNFLIIQTAFIGDVVLVTPLIEGLKKAFPQSRVDFMVIPGTKNLLENNPFVDDILVFDKYGRHKGISQMSRIVGTLRKKRYTHALVPHRFIRSALVAKLGAVPRRIGFNRSAGWFLFTDKVYYSRNIHEVERNFSLLKPLGIDAPLCPPRIFPDSGDQELVSRFLTLRGVKDGDTLVALAPGSAWPTKRWPPEGFIEVAYRLSGLRIRVILIGGRADRLLCDEIGGQVKDRIINAAGRLTLRQTAELLRRCRVLVANDSAPVHLAVAMGTRVIAIFGPTIPGFGFYPYGEGHRIIEKDLACRPCGIHGGMECPIGTHECMKAISADEIIERIVDYL
ncbi:lipopolysaccharide heptosyltransferase II [candidate division KSB1 bacterium]|nr:lipopolysaccharide heptosyltransferase II [candidate division KSB1 bacterium]